MAHPNTALVHLLRGHEKWLTTFSESYNSRKHLAKGLQAVFKRWHGDNAILSCHGCASLPDDALVSPVSSWLALHYATSVHLSHAEGHLLSGPSLPFAAGCKGIKLCCMLLWHL